MSKINSINNKSQDFTIDPASGDSWTQYSIGGTAKFRIGVDDDASDAFKLSQGSALGTNDTFLMSSAGERTMPLQPIFFAKPSADLLNVTGDNTTYKCAFNSEDYDIGSNYNTGTYEFTAPVTGRYMFVANITIEDAAAAHTISLAYITTTSQSFRLTQISFAAGQYVAGGIYTINGCALATMTAGDTATLYLLMINGTKIVDISATDSWFSGFLVC